MTAPPFVLADGDAIVTAWAAHSNGTEKVWTIIRERGGKLREEVIYLRQMDDAMLTLLEVSEAAHKAMLGAVRARYGR